MLGQNATTKRKEKPVVVGKRHILMSPPQHQGILAQTVCGFFLLICLLASDCRISLHGFNYNTVTLLCQGKSYLN